MRRLATPRSALDGQVVELGSALEHIGAPGKVEKAIGRKPPDERRAHRQKHAINRIDALAPQVVVDSCAPESGDRNLESRRRWHLADMAADVDRDRSSRSTPWLEQMSWGRRSSKVRRWINLIFASRVPHYRAPSHEHAASLLRESTDVCQTRLRVTRIPSCVAFQDTFIGSWLSSVTSCVYAACSLCGCSQSHPKPTDVPDEGSQFACDREDGDVCGLPSGEEFTISPAQPQLCI